MRNILARHRERRRSPVAVVLRLVAGLQNILGLRRRCIPGYSNLDFREENIQEELPPRCYCHKKVGRRCIGLERDREVFFRPPIQYLYMDSCLVVDDDER